MSRVEIEGQFSVDNTFSACNGGEIKVDRSVSFSEPQNWVSFCDSADEILREATIAKQWFKIYGTIAIFLFIAVYSIFNVPSIWKVASNEGGENSMIVLLFLALVITAVYGIYVNCAVRGKLKRPMEKVRSLCTEKSGSGVRYQLTDEHYGGCNKPHVRRYYIMVFVDDEESPSPFDDIKESPHLTDTLHHEEGGGREAPWQKQVTPYQGTLYSDPIGSAGGNDHTVSLFDQLKV